MSRLRIRTIKPEFFADERVNALPVAGRYLALGLITRADDRGRQRRQDAAIAAHVFPEGDVGVKQVAKLLELVIGAGIALVYVAQDHVYLWLPNFWKHQRINRPSESDVPPHPDDPFGSMPIGDALQAFKESSSQPHGQFTESSVSTQHSPAVPLPSVPEKNQDDEGPTTKLDMRAIFDDWLAATGRDAARTKLDPKRERVIVKALASHGVVDCLDAVRNIGRDAWARGDNDRGRRFDDLEHALGSAERIERWRDWTPSTRPRKESPSDLIRAIGGAA